MKDIIIGARSAFFTFLLLAVFTLVGLSANLMSRIGELEHTVACMNVACVVTGPGDFAPSAWRVTGK